MLSGLKLDNGYSELQIDVESIHGITVTIEFGKSIESDSDKPKSVNIGEIPKLDEVLYFYGNKDGEFTESQIKDDFKLSEYYARKIREELLEKKLIIKVGKGLATYYKMIEDLED